MVATGGLPGTVQSGARELAWMVSALQDTVRRSAGNGSATVHLYAGAYARLLCAARELFPADPVLVGLALPKPATTTPEELADAAGALAMALQEKLAPSH